MATKASIIAGIEFKVGQSANYTGWNIGVTHDPEKSQRDMLLVARKNTERWSDWQANSLGEGEEIVGHFTEKGMSNMSDSNLSRFKPVFVYVF